MMPGWNSDAINQIVKVIIVVLGLFFLFAITMEFFETSLLLLTMSGIFVFYIACILPNLDRRIHKYPLQSQKKRVKKLISGENYDLIVFVAVTTLSFVVIHMGVLLMHEFSHSFFAFFIGYKQDPLNIIFGNWIGSHWDENVDYITLFQTGRGFTAAAIAFAGPCSNIILFFIMAAVLSLKSVKKHCWIYHSVFWAMIITFVMIFEYVFTRSFIANDDFGNINHGLGLSPWPIFITGTFFGLLGLYFILKKKIPEYYSIVTEKSRAKQYITIGYVSFVIFLFYIGVSVLKYPEIPRWWCGAAGILALFIVPFLASPGRKWVKDAIKDIEVTTYGEEKN